MMLKMYFIHSIAYEKGIIMWPDDDRGYRIEKISQT